MATNRAPVRRAGASQAVSVVDRFNKMAEAIPEGEEDTGLVSILGQLAAADSPEKLGDPWSMTGGEKYIDREILVTDLKRRPSDYPDGLAFYLIVTAKIDGAGEPVTFSTGAASVAAQLVKAHAMGWLPLACIIRKAKKASKSGYYPLHLEVLGTEAAL